MKSKSKITTDIEDRPRKVRHCMQILHDIIMKHNKIPSLHVQYKKQSSGMSNSRVSQEIIFEAKDQHLPELQETKKHRAPKKFLAEQYVFS